MMQIGGGPLPRVWKSFFCIFLLTIAFGTLYNFRFEEYVALKGFSPIGFLEKKHRTENFAKDFPSGIEAFDSSSLVNVCEWVREKTDVAPLNLERLIIFLEIGVLLLALYFFIRALGG